LADTSIEVGGEIDTAMDEALGRAARRLAAAWPAGNALLCGLVHRLQLDPDPELNSKTESELPGVIFLGRHRTDSMSIAELLVHEAGHLLVYEVALLAPILPAPHEIRRSPFSAEGSRPAYMVLHGTVSFLAQAIATLRLHSDSAGIEGRLRTELARLRTGAQELRTHLDAHGATPHPFITALFGELALLGETIGR
jgi:HEXXH motif-containing protein